MSPIPPVCERITFTLRTCCGYVTTWGWGTETLLIRNISALYEGGTRLYCFISREENKLHISDAFSEEFVAAHL